ncbi:transposase [Chloroflexia bacterium SDU3-3]|nr:transposase [Chloroflexia bacterium SDU3-3]
MLTEEIIIRLFCMVDDTIGPVEKRSDAKLHDSEIVTIALVFSLRGGLYRRFYRWLNHNYRFLFPNLPSLSRLLRVFKRCAQYTDAFLAEATFFTVADTYGIERCHPRREGRSAQQVGKKGLSNGRWMIGVKLGWLINNAGKVVTWQWDTANVSDREFRDMALAYNGQTITLCDGGFRQHAAVHENMLFWAKGTWNERFMIETNFSWACLSFTIKKIYHRKSRYIDARLGYVTALINCLLELTSKSRSLTEFVI